MGWTERLGGRNKDGSGRTWEEMGGGSRVRVYEGCVWRGGGKRSMGGEGGE